MSNWSSKKKNYSNSISNSVSLSNTPSSEQMELDQEVPVVKVKYSKDVLNLRQILNTLIKTQK